MTLSEMDSLKNLTVNAIRNRIALGEAVLADGISENAGATALKEVSRQLDVLNIVLKQKLEIVNAKPKAKKDGIIIKCKPVNLALIKGTRYAR